MAENIILPVILSEAAIADISELGRWITQQADFETANAYVSRIEAVCYRLGEFPNRGTPRFDISVGLRSITFERRRVIAYRVLDGCVRIVRVLHAAQNYAELLKDI